MNRRFQNLLFLVLSIAVITGCGKEERIVTPRYMQVAVESFFPDTALYCQVKIDDMLLADFTASAGGQIINLINGINGQIPFVDSGHLKITIVKKSSPNIIFDSLVYFTNDNNFLLLQLDATQRASLINKSIATATEIRPGTDSLKVRFFYNKDDEIKRNDKILSSIDIQLYSFFLDELGATEQPELKNEGRIQAVKIGALSPYYSINYQKDNRPRGYVFEIYPPGSTPSTKPQYPRKYDEYDGYIGGALLTSPSKGNFQTFRITKIEPYTTYRNGLFLFGFQ